MKSLKEKEVEWRKISILEHKAREECMEAGEKIIGLYHESLCDLEDDRFMDISLWTDHVSKTERYNFVKRKHLELMEDFRKYHKMSGE